MVRAWYMDTDGGDQRLEHRAKDASDVSLEQLKKLGVLYWKVECYSRSYYTTVHCLRAT